MGLEIERKFLVNDVSFLKKIKGIFIKQGYIHIGKNTVSRIRVVENKKAFITVKGRTGNISRLEYEYEIPLKDGMAMLNYICIKPIIEKNRFRVKFGNHIWEIDVFEGENKGLVLAEIELKREDEFFEKPPWIGKEVSKDERFYNYYLVKHPYLTWKIKG